jgi:DNA invertase Pin-like site-specific DNA recombinase
MHNLSTKMLLRIFQFDVSIYTSGLKSQLTQLCASTRKLIFHIFWALSEFEKNLIQERSRVDLEAARVRGRQGGRPKKLNQNKHQLVVGLYQGKKHSIKQICEMVGIPKPTLYKYVNAH